MKVDLDYNTVRLLAGNPNVSEQVLMQLADKAIEEPNQCSGIDICIRLADNPNTSTDTLTKIYKSVLANNVWLKYSLIHHPKFPYSLMEEILTSDDHDSRRAEVLSNTGITRELFLHRLQRDIPLSRDEIACIIKNLTIKTDWLNEALVKTSVENQATLKRILSNNRPALHLPKVSQEPTSQILSNFNAVVIQGTNHPWFKVKGLYINYYQCGCFIGNRKQLLRKIYQSETLDETLQRLAILQKLDNYFYKYLR